MEKYNVVDTQLEAGGGEYPGQDGFGWTNGVLLALIKKYEITRIQFDYHHSTSSKETIRTYDQVLPVFTGHISFLFPMIK